MKKICHKTEAQEIVVLHLCTRFEELEPGMKQRGIRETVPHHSASLKPLHILIRLTDNGVSDERSLPADVFAVGVGIFLGRAREVVGVAVLENWELEA